MIKKIAFEEVSKKVGELWRHYNMDIVTWERELTKLVEESGWTRAEWDARVAEKHGTGAPKIKLKSKRRNDGQAS